MSDKPRKRRCSAMTRSGRRCRKLARWEPEGGGARDRDRGALCAWHAGRAAAHGGRRCRARKAGGERCRAWTMKGERFCSVHLGHVGERRRCVARRKDGKLCGQWGLRNSEEIYGRVLCHWHSGKNASVEGDERRCTALTRAGQPCRAWATVASRQQGQPLCPFHGEQWASGPGGRRCTATTASGAQCKQRALPDDMLPGDQLLCWAHAYPQRRGALHHGYHRLRSGLGEEARAAVEALEAEGRSVEAQLLVARLKLADLLAYTGQEELSIEQWATLARLVNLGLRKVARLERARAGRER